jgi:peptidoglycan/xylan/chitin deacetylase (PgdA/CDA1 family)
MSLKHSLLSAVYLPLRTKNNLLRRFGAKTDARLRIINYHNIAPKEQEKFAAQLRWLARSWKFVSPQLFAAMMNGDEPIEGANLLLTFDDGFASNRRVAEEVLNPMGIQALFFVVPDFVNIVNEDESRDFIATNIWRSRTPETEDWRNMTWTDLAWLIETGHTIGAHTKSHARLSDLKEDRGLETEIIECADVLKSKLSVEIEHFAYPFGNLASFSPSALAVAMQRFKFIYTGLRGDNAVGVPAWALRRDAIDPPNSFGLIGALLEGGADSSYSNDFSQYLSWWSNKK